MWLLDLPGGSGQIYTANSTQPRLGYFHVYSNVMSMFKFHVKFVSSFMAIFMSSFMFSLMPIIKLMIHIHNQIMFQVHKHVYVPSKCPIQTNYPKPNLGAFILNFLQVINYHTCFYSKFHIINICPSSRLHVNFTYAQFVPNLHMFNLCRFTCMPFYRIKF